MKEYIFHHYETKIKSGIDLRIFALIIICLKHIVFTKCRTSVGYLFFLIEVTATFLWFLSLFVCLFWTDQQQNSKIGLLAFLPKSLYASVKLIRNPMSVCKQFILFFSKAHLRVNELVFSTSTLPGKRKEAATNMMKRREIKMHLSLPPFSPLCLPSHSLWKEMEANLSIYCMCSCSSPAVNCLKELHVRLGRCESRN